MNNFLINESAVSVAPTISKRNANTIEFVAVLQEADRPNRNGRMYPKTVLEQALNAPYVQERLRTKSFYSEAGHPSDTSVQRQMTIDQRNIACIIKEFWWEGNLLKAKVETANTAIGRDMMGLIEQGSRVAFSLRAQGNVHRDERLGLTIVESPVQIATYDWVVNPSHDKAFLESICEATQFAFFGKNQRLSLAESSQLFEQGNLIALNEVAERQVIDYAKHYGKKIKALSETYIYDAEDQLKIDGNFAILENGTVTKKVMLEDYILKDVRYRIRKLAEETITERPVILQYDNDPSRKRIIDDSEADRREKEQGLPAPKPGQGTAVDTNKGRLRADYVDHDGASKLAKTGKFQDERSIKVGKYDK